MFVHDAEIFHNDLKTAYYVTKLYSYYIKQKIALCPAKKLPQGSLCANAHRYLAPLFALRIRKNAYIGNRKDSD